jgi:hypothetical protein
MEPEFTIKEGTEGVELSFTTGNGRKPLKLPKPPDTSAAVELIERIIKNCIPSRVVYCECKNRHYFSIFDSEGHLVCRSRNYTRPSLAKDARVMILELMPKVKVSTKSPLDLDVRPDEDDDDEEE